MNISRPIIIVGTGRCGSTVFQRLIATHPQAMWLSNVSDYFPRSPAWNRWAVAAMGNPMLRRAFGGRIQPAECYRFWDTHTYGFSEPCRDLVRSDVTARMKKQVRAAFQPMLTPTRSRLLLKITGWPRIGFLSEIFEDARFVHVMRDGRAVANSMINVHFWQGWKGPQRWGWGELSRAQKEEWNEHGQSFVVLAAIQWKILMDAMEKAKNTISSERFLEIRYEDLCSDPVGQVQKVIKFGDLEWTVGFERRLGEYQLENTNYKYKHDLTAKQQSDLEEVLEDYLRRYGYL